MRRYAQSFAHECVRTVALHGVGVRKISEQVSASSEGVISCAAPPPCLWLASLNGPDRSRLEFPDGHGTYYVCHHTRPHRSSTPQPCRPHPCIYLEVCGRRGPTRDDGTYGSMVRSIEYGPPTVCVRQGPLSGPHESCKSGVAKGPSAVVQTAVPLAVWTAMLFRHRTLPYLPT